MKYRWLLVFALTALLLSVPAYGEEAQEITAQCTFTISPRAFKVERMTDRDWATPNITEPARNPWVEVESPTPMYGVYVCFGTKLYPWEIQARHGGQWVTVYESPGAYAHEYAPLPDGEMTARMVRACCSLQTSRLAPTCRPCWRWAPSTVSTWAIVR